jgi:methylmalonyl-CoA/ethylmalonyl-CoA epimerase
MFDSLDHIGVAVADLEPAISFYVDVFELPLEHRETVTEQGVEAALLGVGDSHVELLAPLGAETPIGRFIDKRGPGLHHAAYRCQDIESALERCRAEGLRLIDERPRRGIRGSLVAFVHPAATGGVLTELVQPAESH